MTGTHHFHIDPNGYLFTGLCPGIVAAEADDFHPAKSPQDSPVFCTLCDDGPFGLLQIAIERYGYRTEERGYISKCDLCLSVREHLVASADFDELRPQDFYDG